MMLIAATLLVSFNILFAFIWLPRIQKKKNIEAKYIEAYQGFSTVIGVPILIAFAVFCIAF